MSIFIFKLLQFPFYISILFLCYRWIPVENTPKTCSANNSMLRSQQVLLLHIGIVVKQKIIKNGSNLSSTLASIIISMKQLLMVTYVTKATIWSAYTHKHLTLFYAGWQSSSNLKKKRKEGLLSDINMSRRKIS